MHVNIFIGNRCDNMYVLYVTYNQACPWILVLGYLVAALISDYVIYVHIYLIKSNTTM